MLLNIGRIDFEKENIDIKSKYAETVNLDNYPTGEFGFVARIILGSSLRLRYDFQQ